MLHFISTSDWHFEGLEKLFPTNHIDLQIAQIKRIYEHAVENGINHVFVPGDIADVPHMEWSTYIKLVTLLKAYDGHIHTYYLAGNHDFSDIKRTSLDLLQLLVDNNFFKTFHLYLQPDSTVIDEVPVTFLPYPLNSKDAERSLNFAHITVPGAIGDNGRVIKESEHEFEHPEKGFIISGHIHQYQHMKNQRVIYNGNPYQKNFGEALPKGFIECQSSVVKKRISVKHKQVILKPNYRLINKAVEEQEDLSGLSNSPYVRYKLKLAGDVVLPSDLRVQHPNIHSITDVRNKAIVLEDEDSEKSVSSVNIDPIDGLKEALKDIGMAKKDIQMAKGLVLEALDHLKITPSK